MEALLPLIITFGLMWALLIRPQQRRVRQHQELVATLTAGDEVITTGGIVGSIASVVDDIITLEVAPGTFIRVLRSAIQSRIAPYATDEADEADSVVDDDELFDEAQFEEAQFEEAQFEEAQFEEAQFEAEPAAEAPGTDTVTDTIVTDVDQRADISYIPPPATPPSATPPPTIPPSTGEKA